MMELGPTPGVIGDPAHPYTGALIALLPEPDPRVAPSEEQLRSCSVPNLLGVPESCPLRPGCHLHEGRPCDTERPATDVVVLGYPQAVGYVMAGELGQPERITASSTRAWRWVFDQRAAG